MDDTSFHYLCPFCGKPTELLDLSAPDEEEPVFAIFWLTKWAVDAICSHLHASRFERDKEQKGKGWSTGGRNDKETRYGVVADRICVQCPKHYEMSVGIPLTTDVAMPHSMCERRPK